MNLNKKNKDGSVNSFQLTENPGHGFYVPLHYTRFTEQIEEHILPAVLHLNSVGYKTVTSCQGHSLFDYLFKKAIRFNFGPQITIEVEKEVSKQLFTTVENFFVKVVENNTIEFDKSDKMFVSFKIKFLLNFFFTNKFLCKQIYKVIQHV